MQTILEFQFRFLLDFNAKKMNIDLKIETETCLLMFDIHQNITWAQSILAAESGNFSHLVLGGDYFDSKAKEASTVTETCRFLMEVADTYADKVTILLGNHDVQYLEGRHRYLKYRNPKKLNYKLSGFSNNKGQKIAKNLSEDFSRELRLFQLVNGYLISHAGIAKKHWAPHSETAFPLDSFNQYCDEVLNNFAHQYYSILAAGTARGGDEPAGGIIWLDWDDEFSDEAIPYPQIVGHTSSSRGARKNGRSWCLDGKQSCYGLLSKNGILSIKTL